MTFLYLDGSPTFFGSFSAAAVTFLDSERLTKSKLDFYQKNFETNFMCERLEFSAFFCTIFDLIFVDYFSIESTPVLNFSRSLLSEH